MTRKLDDLIATLPKEEQIAIEREAERQIEQELERRLAELDKIATPLIRSVKDTIRVRVAEDAAFRDALLEEVIDTIISISGGEDVTKIRLLAFITNLWPKP